MEQVFTYELKLTEQRDGSFQRQITVLRELLEPAHDRRHNDQVQALIAALGIPKGGASGGVLVSYETKPEQGGGEDHGPQSSSQPQGSSQPRSGPRKQGAA